MVVACGDRQPGRVDDHDGQQVVLVVLDLRPGAGRVERRDPGTASCRPSPNGPFPAPVLYSNARVGCTCSRPAGTSAGTEKVPAPVNRSGANFSPNPPTAPPPLGNEITEPVAVVSLPPSTPVPGTVAATADVALT